MIVRTSLSLVALIVLLLTSWLQLNASVDSHQQSPLEAAGISNDGMQSSQGSYPAEYEWHSHLLGVDGEGGAIALDDADALRISYALRGASAYPQIYLASRPNGDWHTSELLDPESNWASIGALTSLAIDDLGHNHILYGSYTPLSQSVFYFFDNGTQEWSEPVVIDPYIPSSRSISIAVDSQGHAHLSYCAQNPITLHSELWYTQIHAGTIIWLKSPVGEEACRGSTSIAVDDDDVPHIAYNSKADYESPGTLKYAKRIDNEWQIEVVDDSGDVGEHLSLALSSHALPHIGYSYSPINELPEQGTVALKYAVLDGEIWQNQIVYSTANTVDWGLPLSMALAAMDQPRFVVHDRAEGALEYCWQDVDQWRCEAIDNIAYANLGERALVLDSSGHPHIAVDATGVGQIYLHAMPSVNDTYLPELHR